MTGAGYLSAAVLACVFIWAGGSKLTHEDRAADAFRVMGLPAPMIISRAVGLLELAVALLLLTEPFLGGLIALFVLLAFTLALRRAIRSGLNARCGCFGTARHKPVSWVEIVRNGLLAILAAGATIARSPVAPSLPEVVLVTSAVVSGALILALCDLRRDAGAVWNNRLAWEQSDRQ
jgi:uncharacterized membrane protein YphA (DoxX/SURF4 family)